MSSMTAARRPAAGIPLLLLVFGAAYAMRLGLSTPVTGAHPWPSLLFSAALLLVVVAVGTATHLQRRAFAVGVVTAVILVMPALLYDGVRASFPLGWYPAWAAVAIVVSVAEEAFLRGVLFDAVARRVGVDAAIVAGALVFGLMHAPFYGWRAVPVDLAVGLVLGVARAAAGTWTAPAIAHAAADLAGWWVL
jgi:membrane protease YdiL (CAAX protease family)